MDAKTPFQNRFQRLSLARRLLIGALLWSALLVVGGVVAISAVYRAEAVNILDDEALELSLFGIIGEIVPSSYQSRMAAFQKNMRNT